MEKEQVVAEKNVIEDGMRVTAKIRYSDEGSQAILENYEGGKILVKFEKPIRAITPGQSVVFYDGDVVGLLGPNGAGKTTTFFMIVGIIKPNSVKVFFDDVEITKMPMYIRARLGISYLPQEASIFRKLTVEENIMAGLQVMI